MEYIFTGMDINGCEKKGRVEAGSDDEAETLIKERGLFPTSIKMLDASGMPVSTFTQMYDLSVMKIAAADEEFEGGLLPENAAKCILYENNKSMSGVFNLLSENGKRYFVFQIIEGDRFFNHLKVDTARIKNVSKHGLLLWEKVIVELDDHTIYTFKGSVGLIYPILDFETFISANEKKLTSGRR
ncbi:MAG: hypothetical protein WC071_01100 [Victivallaceae bacterium]